MDRADGGGTEDVRDEAAGCTRGDGQRQEAEGGQGHPLPGPRCVDLRHNNRHCTTQLQQLVNSFNLLTLTFLDTF